MFKKIVVLSLGILAFAEAEAQSIFPSGQTGFVGADNCFEYTLHGAGLIQGVEPEWTEFTIDVCMPWVLGGLDPGDVDIGSDFDVDYSWVMGPWGVGQECTRIRLTGASVKTISIPTHFVRSCWITSIPTALHCLSANKTLWHTAATPIHLFWVSVQIRNVVFY